MSVQWLGSLLWHGFSSWSRNFDTLRACWPPPPKKRIWLLDSTILEWTHNNRDKSQNNYVEWKKTDERDHIIYKTLENTTHLKYEKTYFKIFKIWESISVLAQRGEGGEAVVGGLERGRNTFLSLMSICTDLIILMVSWMYAWIKTYKIIQSKYVHFIVSLLYFNKI